MQAEHHALLLKGTECGSEAIGQWHPQLHTPRLPTLCGSLESPGSKLLIRLWSRRQSELVGQNDICSHVSNVQKKVTGKQLPVWNVPCTRLVLLCVC